MRGWESRRWYLRRGEGEGETHSQAMLPSEVCTQKDNNKNVSSFIPLFLHRIDLNIFKNHGLVPSKIDFCGREFHIFHIIYMHL